MLRESNIERIVKTRRYKGNKRPESMRSCICEKASWSLSPQKVFLHNSKPSLTKQPLSMFKHWGE